ncbi:hypothetical protein Cgig2_008565 [Carnegiea gigantea]|uniref:WRKY domain-containing protein n=1 Tax=Carnegiea gigantea TaxID=171969 RepID=A0A9Q1JRC3_9CARY|nr:hypothetical protein Cgig2_008565 [Carnegiea gigantea]
MLHNPDNFSSEDNQFGNSKSHDSAAETPRKDRRGCYKRRRNVESVVVDTPALTDDGFAWRKYGQKVILNTTHPRNYYRCTHKIDQGCQATKQVQQISENPTKYRIIYHGNHTCKNPLKIPSVFINSTTPENPDSSVYLSFEANTPTAQQGLNHPTPSNFFFSNTMVKQEYGPIKAETPSAPSDHHQDHSSPSSPDRTTTTPRSEISSGEVYSSVASPHGMDIVEDYYCYMMAAESGDLNQFFQSLLCA